MAHQGHYKDNLLIMTFIALFAFIKAELSVIPQFKSYECYSCSYNTFSMDGDVLEVNLPGEVASISVQTLCADPFRHERKTLKGNWVKFEGYLPVAKCPTSKCQKINVQTNNRGDFVVRRCLPSGASCQKNKVFKGTNITQTVNCCDGHMCNGVDRPATDFWWLLSTVILLFVSLTYLT
ncbi:uncharacterized protein LOC135496929 [Lineus longissimus]|uniref:uncharacterized protein LOC135496929 n=1 Tax=Lineus longissimus TaxID=88925 RepID=UPI002B4C4F27